MNEHEIQDINDMTVEEKLPRAVIEWTNTMGEVSRYNEYPAILEYFCLLGQILKDMITIPYGYTKEDTRFHVGWVQTARSGKSVLNDFLTQITLKTFKYINAQMGRHEDDPYFTMFDVVDYTDAALIGSVKTVRNEHYGEEGHPTSDEKEVEKQVYGALEGSGLALFDEFESSGIFKKKANNENVLVYLQKFMNGLESKSNIIRKRLAGGDKEIVCDCQRSMYATTYVPTNFLEILFNSGALQRALVYVREIDEDILHIQRDTFIDGLGEEFDGFPECERFANALVRIYQEVGKRFNEVGVKSKVFTFDPNAKEVLRLSYNKMEYIILNHPPKIRKLARSFQINLIQYEMIFSTLICAIESVNRTQGKFAVTAKNMHQARKVVEPCYDYLIEWLQNSIRGDVVTAELQHTSRVKTFKETYNGFEKKDGWVNQKEYLYEVAAKMSKGTSTIYRYWKKDNISQYFESKQVVRTTYIKWRKQE